MISCAVYGCTNSLGTNSDPTIHYYFFPKHPVIAQQWVTACWRADPIDLNTARICSIHFDNNSYTSEYKFLDYLGNYTRVLTYDAVPTLYLPNPHTPVIMKATIDQPVTISTDPLNSHEIKEIVVYEVQNISDQASNSNFEENQIKEYIQIDTHHPILSNNVKFDEHNQTAQIIEEFGPVENSTSASIQEVVNYDEKYKHIENRQQLEALKNENISIRQKIEHFELVLKRLQEQAPDKSQAVKSKDEQLKKLMQQFDAIDRSSMTLVDQKSVLSKVFSESQIKILSGKKKIYWSNDDMAMGYTIRHLSNKRCYMYLSKNLNIPLPALSSIKRWSTLKKNEFEKEEKKDDIKFEDDDNDSD